MVMQIKLIVVVVVVVVVDKDIALYQLLLIKQDRVLVH